MFLILKFGLAYKKLQKRHRIQAVHFNDVWSTIGLFFFCPNIFHIPRVYTFHGNQALEISINDKSTIQNKISLFLLSLFQNVVVHLCSTVVAVSVFSFGYLRKYYHVPFNRLVYIPNAIYSPKTIAKIYRKRTDIFTIGMISRFTKTKGHLILLKALQLLTKKYHVRYEAIICGPYDYFLNDVFMKYQDLGLFDKVRLFPNANEARKRQLYKVFDVTVAPSQILEQCPYSILESFVNGIPVIGTPTGGVPELVTKVDGKFVTNNFSAEALASVLAWYSGTRQPERGYWRRRCIEVVSEFYNPERYYSMYTHLYKINV
ncbi:MAG TPA: glycosyltransferase family 4 protein [Candidatus Saccharimonadales bacterium]|nr:glycosyltransferase family 4 protein [Candidatus Saccharimonadales bacterium]